MNLAPNSSCISYSDRLRNLDHLIGKARIVIGCSIGVMGYYTSGNNNWLKFWFLLLAAYSFTWYILHRIIRNKSTFGAEYLHIFGDLFFIGVFSYYKPELMLSYYGVIYIIPLLMLLNRYGKKTGLIFAVLSGIQMTVTCILLSQSHVLSNYFHLAVMLAIVYFNGNIVEVDNRLREKLINLSTRDGLTGVYNLRYFQEQLGKELERSDRNGRPVSMIFLDIDDFKLYNDTYGHDAANETLVELTRILAKSLRNMDTVARYGGEEIALLLPETDSAEAFTVAERLRKAIEHHPFKNRQVTVSAGVATYPGNTAHSNNLVKTADKAMYQAKREGKNRTICLEVGV